MKYADFKQGVDNRLDRAIKRRDLLQVALLTKVLFQLPDDKPKEALTNMLVLVQGTTDAQSMAYYRQFLQAVGQLEEVRG